MAEPTPAPTPYRAIYGFACCLFFTTLFILYICWALIPEYILQDVLRLTYLPDKYFALFLPILVLSAITIFAFLIYPSWNLSMQNDVNDLHTIRDNHMIVRCQHINQSTGLRCKKKVDEIPANASNNFNKWLFEKYCSEHMDRSSENMPTESEIDNNTKFCDCMDKTKCWLHKHPNHLSVLHKRATVPTVCDVYVGDICKELFLEE